jgi:DNA-binding CsgD family transcriptional regulator
MKKSPNDGVDTAAFQNGPLAKTLGDELTVREVEALTWVARGKTSAEIALILGLTKRTVDFHISNVCATLGVAKRVEAVAKAAVSHIIEVRSDIGE